MQVEYCSSSVIVVTAFHRSNHQMAKQWRRRLAPTSGGSGGDVPQLCQRMTLRRLRMCCANKSPTQLAHIAAAFLRDGVMFVMVILLLTLIVCADSFQTP